MSELAIKAGIGSEITSPQGEQILVPAALPAAIRAATLAAPTLAGTGFDAWLTGFANALMLELHKGKLAIVPLGFAKSTETVNINTYTLALAGKHHAERKVQAALEIFRGDNGAVIGAERRGDLHAEFDAAVMALTGHAPLGGVGRIGGVDERLRALRLLLLNVPLDEEAADVPMPSGELGQGEVR